MPFESVIIGAVQRHKDHICTCICRTGHSNENTRFSGNKRVSVLEYGQCNAWDGQFLIRGWVMGLSYLRCNNVHLWQVYTYLVWAEFVCWININMKYVIYEKVVKICINRVRANVATSNFCVVLFAAPLEHSITTPPLFERDADLSRLSFSISWRCPAMTYWVCLRT